MGERGELMRFTPPTLAAEVYFEVQGIKAVGAVVDLSQKLVTGILLNKLRKVLIRKLPPLNRPRSALAFGVIF